MSKFLVLLQFFKILTAFTITTSEQYRRSDEKNNVYFVEHLNRMLNIDQLASYKVYDSMACGLHCIRHELCISVNFAVEADLTGHSCALLKADRFRYPNKLNWNNSYHHYSLAVRKKFINAKIIPKNSYQICFRLKPRGEYYSNRNWGFRGIGILTKNKNKYFKMNVLLIKERTNLVENECVLT